MSGDCGSPEAAAEGLRSDTGVLLGCSPWRGYLWSRRVGDRHSRKAAVASCCATECAGRFARLNPALLVEGLEIPNHLGNDADKLPRDVSDILLAKLALWLPSKTRHAERRLELRPKLLLPERRQAALQRGILQLRLALQHADDLRHDRQDLFHHFIHILLAQQARRLAVGGISKCCVRLLCLSENLRQDRQQLPHDFADVLLRKLPLLLAPPLRLLLPQPLRLGAPSKRTDGRLLSTVLTILLAIGRLAQSITGPLHQGRIEQSPLLRIEL